MSPMTVAKGSREVRAGERLDAGRVRRFGGGRRSLTETDETLVGDLEALVAAEARGHPESPLLWTAKSVRALARALREKGHQVSHETVAKLLRDLGYSLQANRKTLEGASHLDRDAAVCAHQRYGRGRAGGRAADDLCGHQEQGADRRFQKQRPGMAACGQAG